MLLLPDGNIQEGDTLSPTDIEANLSTEVSLTVLDVLELFVLHHKVCEAKALKHTNRHFSSLDYLFTPFWSLSLCFVIERGFALMIHRLVLEDITIYVEFVSIEVERFFFPSPKSGVMKLHAGFLDRR